MKTLLIIWQILRFLLIVGILTILTQVGGVVYILYKIGISIYQKRQPTLSTWKKRSVFVGFYLLTCLLIVPLTAPYFGRVPLPYFATADAPIQPRMWLTCLANRHYVRPPLKQAAIEISQQLQKENPSIRLIYLDANFPFIDGFPLLPHLSHHDGKKLDLAYLYKNKKGELVQTAPSFYGYGICEAPKKNEYNQPKICEDKGYWQYNALEKITPNVLNRYQFDKKANRKFMRTITRHPAIQKILIEPHLKRRLGFQGYSKVRFAGCHSVRHDDHIHIQL